MKFLPLVLANLLRKKIRTTLTVGSFMVAAFLFCLLLTIDTAWNQGVVAAGVDRMIIMNKVSFVQPLPLAYRDRVLRTKGIKEVTFATWFGGVYQDERNIFPQLAIDAASYRSIYREFLISDEEWAAFVADRAGCVAGLETARRYGWKVGDRIPIKGTFWTGNWEFNLRAIYRGSRPIDDQTQFWFHWEYMDEKAPQFDPKTPYVKGFVGWYVLRIDSGADVVQLAKAIDGSFANSAWETRTQPEQAFMADFIKQAGNIELLMLVIGTVVVFTLLLITGNTMAAAVRERTAEMAVLKTIGYGDSFVMGLVLIESLLVAALGGLLGVSLGKAITLAGDPTGGLLPGFYLYWQWMALAFALTLGVGLAAGFIPALSALRLQVAQALRRL